MLDSNFFHSSGKGKRKTESQAKTMEVSLIYRIQEMEERISGIEYQIEEMDILGK